MLGVAEDTAGEHVRVGLAGDEIDFVQHQDLRSLGRANLAEGFENVGGVFGGSGEACVHDVKELAAMPSGLRLIMPQNAVTPEGKQPNA